jgi:hypothetical protein
MSLMGRLGLGRGLRVSGSRGRSMVLIFGSPGISAPFQRAGILLGCPVGASLPPRATIPIVATADAFTKEPLDPYLAVGGPAILPEREVPLWCQDPVLSVPSSRMVWLSQQVLMLYCVKQTVSS